MKWSVGVLEYWKQHDCLMPVISHFSQLQLTIGILGTLAHFSHSLEYNNGAHVVDRLQTSMLFVRKDPEMTVIGGNFGEYSDLILRPPSGM